MVYALDILAIKLLYNEMLIKKKRSLNTKSRIPMEPGSINSDNISILPQQHPV